MNHGNMWQQDYDYYGPDSDAPNLPLENLIAADYLVSNEIDKCDAYSTSVDPFRPYTSCNTQRPTEPHRPLLNIGGMFSQLSDVNQSSPSSFGSSPYSALSQGSDCFPPTNEGEQVQYQWSPSEVTAASSNMIGIDSMQTSFPLASTYFGEQESQIPSQHTPKANHRHSDIMADDKRNLLELIGIFLSTNIGSSEISLEFTRQLGASLTNNVHSGMNRSWGRPTKANVSSEAGKAASEHRRKVPAHFFCELRGVCGASFTRKNGLINHYKAHLGITDKQCRFCRQAFTTSVGRHEKKCKQNPENYDQKQTLSMLMPPGPMY